MALAAALALAALACGGGGGRSPRLLVVGWDGATFELLDPLLAQGRLPNLARLIERGSSASCRSTVVPISSAAWTSAVTGMTPAHHGVYDFFAPRPDSYAVELVSARSNQSPPLWRILGWHGRSSIVFGVPLTWPPETIDGVMVSGMLAPEDGTYAHPPEYADELRSRGFVPDVGIWRESQELTQELLTTQLAIKQAALKELLAGEDWDFAMVVFKCLDVLSHRAYDGRVQGAVAAWCVELDRALGELVAAVGEGTDVIVLSDHGFHAYPFEFYPYAWLLAEGYATARAAAPEAPLAGPLATARPAEHAQRVSALDLARTRVLAGAAEGNFGGLRLNLRGRESEGALAHEEAGALLAELEQRLRALALPGSGEPLVVDVWRAEELYPGPFAAGLLPDLLFETHPDVAVRPVPHDGWLARRAGTFPDHAREGIWVAAGPSFAARAERGRAEITDLAPTALHLLGLPVYAEMQGRVLTELLAAAPAARAPRSISGREHAAGRTGIFASEEGAASAEVLGRLRMLGYTDAVEGPGAGEASGGGGAPEDR